MRSCLAMLLAMLKGLQGYGGLPKVGKIFWEVPVVLLKSSCMLPELHHRCALRQSMGGVVGGDQKRSRQGLIVEPSMCAKATGAICCQPESASPPRTTTCFTRTRTKIVEELPAFTGLVEPMHHLMNGLGGFMAVSESLTMRKLLLCRQGPLLS